MVSRNNCTVHAWKVIRSHFMIFTKNKDVYNSNEFIRKEFKTFLPSKPDTRICGNQQVNSAAPEVH